MGGITLYGGPNSPFVRKVVVSLIEKGAIDQVDLVRINPPATAFAVHPGLIAKNPLGKIPALELADGDFLFESDVICEYIEQAFDGPVLIPADPAERLQVLRWNALGTGALEGLILWRGEILRPEGRSEGLLENSKAKTIATLSLLETQIPKLAAAPLGMGHIAIGCLLGYLDFRFGELNWRSHAPASAAWFATIAARESFAVSYPTGEKPYDGSPAAEQLVWK